MEHSFNTELAEYYGIEEAIIIQNMFFWIRHNVANRKNFYDNRYWTYNTTKAMQELFPYMTESKISRSINKLSEYDVIIKGNYNKQPFDRTCWYAFTDKFVCKLQNLGMDLFKMKNGDMQNDETIPDNKQDIENKDKKVSKKEKPIWMTDFGIYRQMVDDAYKTLLNDSSFKEQFEKYNPNLDYELCLEKSVDTFWGIECGWNHKKKSKSEKIDMISTLKKNVDKSKVYKTRKSNSYDKDTYVKSRIDEMEAERNKNKVIINGIEYT